MLARYEYIKAKAGSQYKANIEGYGQLSIDIMQNGKKVRISNPDTESRVSYSTLRIVDGIPRFRYKNKIWELTTPPWRKVK